MTANHIAAESIRPLKSLGTQPPESWRTLLAAIGLFAIALIGGMVIAWGIGWVIR